MGLDNIPKEYPCARVGIAIMTPADDDGNQQIDCNATREAGQCPHAIHFKDQLGGALGIFGTPCWYRGKYGNVLLGIVTTPDDQPPATFYGDSDELNAEGCRKLSGWMRDRAEKFMFQVESENHNMVKGGASTEDLFNDYKYAADWLAWAADNCDGTVAWW